MAANLRAPFTSLWRRRAGTLGGHNCECIQQMSGLQKWNFILPRWGGIADPGKLGRCSFRYYLNQLTFSRERKSSVFGNDSSTWLSHVSVWNWWLLCLGITSEGRAKQGGSLWFNIPFSLSDQNTKKSLFLWFDCLSKRYMWLNWVNQQEILLRRKKIHSPSGFFTIWMLCDTLWLM